MPNTPTILIVDDLAKNVKLLEAHLAATGFQTETAYDGEEALAKVWADPPDLILLDVMMPKIDGFEVCRQIKQKESTRLIPIVMVTALDRIEDKVKGIQAGADDFLTKPVNRHELLARTRSLIRTKLLNDQVLNLKGILTSLFEISTFEKRFSDRSVLLAEFCRRAADLIGAESAAVTFWHGDKYEIDASYNLTDEIWQQEHHDKLNAVRQVMENGETLFIRSSQRDMLERYGLYSGYIGVPLISAAGRTLGAVHAFGAGEDLQEEAVRLLMIVSQRLGYEMQMKDYNTRLEREVDMRTAELQRALGDLKDVNENLSQAQAETIFRLAKAAEYRDEDTAAHLHRMSNYSYIVARELGLDIEMCSLIQLSSTMHDVGKIGIPDSILLKRGRLTPEEYEVMKEHTLIGVSILRDSSSKVLQMSERIALCHHEKFDGSGYPHGLEGNDIPIEARIVAITDVFDALTTKRVYKPAFSVDEALGILKKDNSKHFDPIVYDAFRSALTQILDVKDQFPELVDMGDRSLGM